MAALIGVAVAASPIAAQPVPPPPLSAVLSRAATYVERFAAQS